MGGGKTPNTEHKYKNYFMYVKIYDININYSEKNSQIFIFIIIFAP